MIKYEEITHESTIPFKIFSFRAKNLNRIIAPHWHQSTEVLFVKNGSLKIMLQNKNCILHENEFVVINPNVIHSTRSLNRNWVLCIQFPLSFLKRVTSNAFGNHFIFKDINSSPVTNKEIITLFNKAIFQTENKTKNISYYLDLYSSGLLILKNLINSYSIQTSSRSSVDKNVNILNKSITFINSNYTKNITLKDIAKYLGYSSSYCSKIIKKDLGISFKELINIVRLEQVVIMAKEGQKSFEQIAQETGFKTYRNLYNAFYAVYQMSPKQFIKQSV